MADTIESFVRKLQEDGLRAGEEAGDQVRHAAQQEAAQIIEAARLEAESMLKAARQENRHAAERQQHELELAARDVLLKLQHQICRALETVLADDVADILDNPDTLLLLIEKVTVAFAQQNAVRPLESLTFRLAREDAVPLVQAALARLRSAEEGDSGSKVEAGLRDFGFEYRLDGAGVEVTPHSVVALLEPYVSAEVSARLRKMMPETAMQ